MTPPLLEAIFGLGCLLSSVMFMTLTTRAINARRQADREFNAWLEGFLRAQAQNRRDAELRILRHLKGENYQGNLGDFEMFTDPDIPPATLMSLPPYPDPKGKKRSAWLWH
jgi:hypothetical protein